MDREHGIDRRQADEKARETSRSAAEPRVRYAAREDAMATAETMMTQYEDVLRELAK